MEIGKTGEHRNMTCRDVYAAETPCPCIPLSAEVSHTQLHRQHASNSHVSHPHLLAVVLSAKVSGKPMPPTAASSAALLLKNGASTSTAVARGKEQRRSLLAPTPSAADAAAWALGNITSAMDSLASSLALGATPAAGYLAAGDAGVWASAANTAGRSLAALPLQAGATAGAGAALDPLANARLTFAGPFVGPCTTVDDSGVEHSEACGTGTVSVTTTYYEDASTFTDVRTAAGASLLANKSGLTGLSAASGVVVLTVSGADPLDGSLPCAAGDAVCSVRIGLPLAGAVAVVSSNSYAASRSRRLHQLVLNSTSELACLRMEGTEVFEGFPIDPSYTVTEVVLASAQAGDGLATCSITRAGT